jgi:uncharacterized membrane protein
MIDYLTRSLGVWFLGFFPLAEIYIAVPAGLDNASIIFWSVFGNFVPVLLITGLYETLTRNERLRTWLDGLLSEKAQGRIHRYGVWFVLVATPFIGVWAMSVTAKALGMDSRRYVIAAFLSILIYATATLVLIRLGLAALLQ